MLHGALIAQQVLFGWFYSNSPPFGALWILSWKFRTSEFQRHLLQAPCAWTQTHDPKLTHVSNRLGQQLLIVQLISTR